MVKTKQALITSVLSALLIGIVHYFAHQRFFETDAVMMVGITIAISVFLVSFIGMKWKDWRK